MNLPTVAYLSPLLAGRVRIRIPSKKGNKAFLTVLQSRLSVLPGIERVAINPLTGSILVLHSLQSGAVVDFLNASGLSCGENGAARALNVHREVTQGFRRLDDQVRSASGGEADIDLLVGGISQAARGNLAALPWYTAYYALIIFSSVKTGRCPRGTAGLKRSGFFHFTGGNDLQFRETSDSVREPNQNSVMYEQPPPSAEDKESIGKAGTSVSERPATEPVSLPCHRRPSMHSGLTGKKNAVDTYGEYSRHSGAALSGKDPTRIDRVGAYAARYAAKNVVAAGLLDGWRCN